MHADATLALPLLATPLARSSADLAAKRTRLNADHSKREMLIDGKPISRESFEETE